MYSWKMLRFFLFCFFFSIKSFTTVIKAQCYRMPPPFKSFALEVRSLTMQIRKRKKVISLNCMHHPYAARVQCILSSWLVWPLFSLKLDTCIWNGSSNFASYLWFWGHRVKRLFYNEAWRFFVTFSWNWTVECRKCFAFKDFWIWLVSAFYCSSLSKYFHNSRALLSSFSVMVDFLSSPSFLSNE